MSTSKKAIEILQRTNDGDNLSPLHLSLVEGAVNRFLNEKGSKAFEELHSQCISEEGYKQPYFHDVEHMTIDHTGYVYYKGNRVEHYDSPWAYSEDAKVALVELKRRCEILESQRKEVNTTNVIWKWED